MKSEKRLARKKTRKRVLKKRLAYGAIVVAVIVLAFLVYSSRQKPSDKVDNFLFKAAIVDHLSKGGIVPWPNQTFINSSRDTLEASDFMVSIYNYEELDVPFYRSIPTKGFGLIIFRVHSAIVEGSTSLGLFTSELFDKNKLQPNGLYYGYIYPYKDALVNASYSDAGPFYFGIAPDFIKYCMQGQFQNTIIILMGCDGLKFNSTAEAFVSKGAKVCIGWSGLVDASHTDKATDYLLKRLVTRIYGVSDVVNETMHVVGPDPSYGSVLECYPPDSDYIIPAYNPLMLSAIQMTIFLARETERISPSCHS